jgi:hypothetical protein
MKYNIAKVREIVIEQQILQNKLIDAMIKKDPKLVKNLFNKNKKYIKNWAKFLSKDKFIYNETIDKLNKANNSAQIKILNNLNLFDNLEAKTKKELKRLQNKVFEQAKIFTWTSPKGRRLNLPYYTNLVTTTAYVYNKNNNTIIKMKANGLDLVKISSHINACPICKPLEGKIYSISGGDNKYPKLPFGKYLNLHPGCYHYLIPVKM